MSQWRKVDNEQVNRPTEEQIDGITIRMLVSPFDVPEAVRGDFNNARKTFAISFKYRAGEESLSEQRFDDDTVLFVGRASGRIYRIEIDLKRVMVNGVALELSVPVSGEVIAREAEQAIHGLSDRLRTPWRSGNYRVAQEVIKDNESELFACLH